MRTHWLPALKMYLRFNQLQIPANRFRGNNSFFHSTSQFLTKLLFARIVKIEMLFWYTPPFGQRAGPDASLMWKQKAADSHVMLLCQVLGAQSLLGATAGASHLVWPLTYTRVSRIQSKKFASALSCWKANAAVALTTCAQSKFTNPQSCYEPLSWSPSATQSKLTLRAQAVRDQGPNTALVCDAESLSRWWKHCKKHSSRLKCMCAPTLDNKANIFRQSAYFSTSPQPDLSGLLRLPAALKWLRS